MSDKTEQEVSDGEELQFSKEVMEVLCGVREIPNKPGKFIKDRSVHPVNSQRDLALEYMTDVVKQMKFTVPVDIQNQCWITDDDIVLGNLVVTVEGTEDKKNAIVVGAHYDVQNNLSGCWRGSYGGYLVTQGADDNTSGTVGCLTVLRRFTKKPPKMTTVVVCFDAEEPGQYNGLAVGSKQFVNTFINTKTEKSLTYVSSVIADMIGATPTTDEGYVVATSRLVDYITLQTQSNENLKLSRSVTILEPKSKSSCLNLSDSCNFPKYGIPTVLLSYLSGFQALPSFYHTERDTVDIINWKTYMEAIDVLYFLATKPLPRIESNAPPVADPRKVAQLMDMGFTKEQSEFALIQKDNDLDSAINLLMD